MATALALIVTTTWTAPVAEVAHAQSTTLIGGGLTALPTVTLGPNKLANSGFESGSAAPWSGGSGWTMDQLTKRAGTFSYRRDTGAPTSSTRLELQPGIYKFSAWVKTQSLGASMRLQFDFRPGINSWFNLEIATGTADWKLYELKNMVVTQPATVTLKLENFNNPSGTAWFDDVKLEEQMPQSVEAFLLYPNFRGMLFDDGPSTMKFDVKVTPPGNDFGRYTVRGTLRDEATGQVVRTQSYPASARFVAELDGGGMQAGRPYLATLALIDGSSGAQVYAYPAYRVSRVPAAARQSMNVSFDAKNRVLIKGRPRFVLGVYDSGMGYSAQDAFWENALWSPTGERRMNDMKINMYLNYWYGEAPIDAMNALMTNLQRHGVTYLQTGNCFDRFPAGTNFNINNSDAYVQQLGAHPGSAGYYTIDECVSTMIPGAFNQYTRLRRLDPDSITFSANFGNPDLHLWRDAADIISTDPYPLYAAEPAGGYNHRTVADWTVMARDTVKNARPIMTVLQFFKFTSLGRWPTLAEMRNHAYMAIVEGARGLWWWSLGDNALKAVCSGWCAEKTAHMTKLKTLVNEIAALEPVLLADDAPGALRGNSNTNVKTRVKVVDGRGYVFAYNATNSSQSATFTWNSAPGTVTVNAENRTLGASSNSFTDTFGPFAAHVYVLGNGGSGGTPPPPSPPPTASPTVAFSAPSAGATVSGTTTVTLAGSGGSGSGYTYTLAAGSTAVTGTGPSFSWNTTTSPNGSVTLTATVRDSAGRTGTATRTVTVANGTTPPPPPSGALRLTVTQPRVGSTVSGTAWATLWLEGSTSTSNTYTLTLGGRPMGSLTTASRGPVSMAYDTRMVVDGAQALVATVRDMSGQTGTTTVSITTSNGVITPPAPAPGSLTASITSPAAGTTVSGSTTVGMSAAGSTATSRTFQLSVDGVVVSTQTVSGTTASYAWNTSGTSNGAHTLSLRVTDTLGGAATTSRTVNVSNAAPSPTPPPSTATLRVAITQPTSAATVRGTVWAVMWVEGQSGSSNTFSLFASGRLVASQVTASRGPVSLPWNTTSGPNGAITLQGTVRDATGKTGSTTIGVTVAN
jgi:hypothetical protein